MWVCPVGNTDHWPLSAQSLGLTRGACFVMWTIVQILYIEQPTIYVFRQFIFPFLSSFQNAFALTSIAIQGFRPCLPCNWKSDIRSCKPNSTLRYVYRQSIGHISWFSMLKKSVIRSCNTPRTPPPHPHNMYWSIYVYEIRSCKPFTVLLFNVEIIY